MYYELYVDSVFFLNFTLNICILYLVDLKSGGTATPLRLIGADFLGSLLFILPFFGHMPLKAAILTGMIAEKPLLLLTAFRLRSLKAFLRVLASYAGYELLIGGVILLGLRIFPKAAAIVQSAVSLSVFTGILSAFIILFKRVNKAEEDCKAVMVLEMGKRVELRAFVDTGNGLIEPISKKPVSVIGKEIFKEIFGAEEPEYYRAIPYRSVGQENGIMKGFFLPKLEVEKDGIQYVFWDVCIGVAQETFETAGIILNPLLFKTKKNGK